MTYSRSNTAILLVDPYNDFISEGGKAWPMVKETADQVGLLGHLKELVSAARAKGYKIFFVPHHRSSPGDLSRWQFPSPWQKLGLELGVFQKDTWGGTFHDDFQPQDGDVVVTEHWASSGFANTDLDTQLRQHGMSKIILIGLAANTCIEATGRFGQELGYHVTLVKDATAAFSTAALHAAHEINGPTYAHEILSTAEVVEALAS